jgi:hypothetical protein
VIISSSLPELISDYKYKLNQQYSLTDLSPVHWLLGIKITRDRVARTILLSQTSYIDAILSCFSLSDAKPVTTPITPGTVLSGVAVVAHLGTLKFLPKIDSDHLRLGLIDSLDGGPDLVSVGLGLDTVEYVVRD